MAVGILAPSEDATSLQGRGQLCTVWSGHVGTGTGCMGFLTWAPVRFGASPTLPGSLRAPPPSAPARPAARPACARSPSGTGGVTSRATLTFLFSAFHLFSSPFFVFSLFPPSPLFCSRDAAKRKAWKLNRVGSLRNIYSSSSANTEGNAPPPPRPARTPPPPRSFHPSVCVFYFTIHVPFSLLKF